jgi:ubiquinone/menaquinone biosynthesis C-methylase UbiE
MADAPALKFDAASVASAYDAYLVPRFFNQFGEHLLSRTGVAHGDVVVDVATGPGTLARQAAVRVGPRGHVIGLDISAAMLNVARTRPPVPGAARIDWVESPAAPLAVKDGVADCVVCHHGLQFFPDKPAAVAEMRRALRPGGHVGLGVWGPLARNGQFAAFIAALEEGGAPDLAKRMAMPFSMGDPGWLGEQLRAAGLRDVTVVTIDLPVTFEGGVEQLLAARAGLPIAPDVEALPAAKRAAIDEALRGRLAPLQDERGRIRVSMESNVAVGRK